MEDIDKNIIALMSIDEAINYCSIDKNKLKLCLKREYWVSFFNNHDLVLPKKNFKSLEDIKDTYDKLKAMQLKDKLMKIIPDNYISIQTPYESLSVYLKLMTDSGMNIGDWHEDMVDKNLSEYKLIVDRIEIDGEIDTMWFYFKNNKAAIFFSYNRKQLENFLFNGIYNELLYINKI